jgi:hypothetical protein
MVSSSIEAMYNTPLVGDSTDPSTILAARSFVDLGDISSDVYIDGGNGTEWYINQNNFLSQVRNFIIDIRQAMVEHPAGLHWQVAQASPNILDEIKMGSHQVVSEGLWKPAA